MREAVRLDRLARRFLSCLGADRASRLCLSLFFKAVLGTSASSTSRRYKTPAWRF